MFATIVLFISYNKLIEEQSDKELDKGHRVLIKERAEI